jgi:lipoprotein-anchoring transpeptidase ErfK/SrfK
MWRTRYSLEADLSERTVVLIRYGNPYRRIRVTIGAPATPTPTGHFAVTDKLVPRSTGVYGCCIVALSGHQPNLRPGWAGGDRIAIHGSPSQATGDAASAGCLRARDRDLRILLRHLTLGTPIVIKD